MNEQNNLQSNDPVKRPKSTWIIIAVVILCALIVFGSVYAWQKNEVNKINSLVTQTQKNTNEQAEQIVTLGEEIAQLKNQLSVIDDKKTADIAYELVSWKTYVNKNDGYSIMYPSKFWPQYDHNIMNYDINDPLYERGNPDGIKIQIQKHTLDSKFKSFDEYIAYQKNVSDGFTDLGKIVKLGDFITMSQYTKNGPGGAFMVYTAFDKNSNNYFDILIFETGYSNNKELVEKIISTFKIL